MSALNGQNAPAVWKVQTTIGTLAGLSSLDIAFYKGQLPIKWEGSVQNAQSQQVVRWRLICSCLTAEAAVGRTTGVGTGAAHAR